jgi:hypothetical protein
MNRFCYNVTDRRAQRLSSIGAVPHRQGNETLPGRPVTVACVCIGSAGEREAKLHLAENHLDVAGRAGVDVACLPEAFAGMVPEPIPGPTTDAIAKYARKYGVYVLCPLIESTATKQYNTAVLLDRAGEIAGVYRKIFVMWGEGNHPSRDGVPVFDLDFGRVAVFTCFDINFPEIWQEADALDAEVVLWPSAYGGGTPLNAYAMLYHYVIVPVGWGNVIDITGENLPVAEPVARQFHATVDLDRTFVHDNFNGEKVARLLAEQPVVIERRFEMEAWWLLRATAPGVRVRDLCRDYAIETLREYLHRSRREIHAIRRDGGTV